MDKNFDELVASLSDEQWEEHIERGFALTEQQLPEWRAWRARKREDLAVRSMSPGDLAQWMMARSLAMRSDPGPSVIYDVERRAEMLALESQNSVPGPGDAYQGQPEPGRSTMDQRRNRAESRQMHLNRIIGNADALQAELAAGQSESVTADPVVLTALPMGGLQRESEPEVEADVRE